MNNRMIDKISKFQKNPQQALKECENDSEAQEFLKEFMKIMGVHLTTNTGKEDHEQKKVNELVNNSDVRELLMDKDVQDLFASLKINPENSQRLVKGFKKKKKYFFFFFFFKRVPLLIIFFLEYCRQQIETCKLKFKN
jgi:hypothetical protein